MALVSMKMTAKEKKERNKPMSIGSSKSGPEYPWGLCIELGKAILDKLNIEAMPKVGDTMDLKAKCEVVRVSSSAGKERTERDISLQITDMSLEEGIADAED